jgi:2-(1,2-epoxy-1,2-dihydrophenyl)acetyl-CoA isomerase
MTDDTGRLNSAGAHGDGQYSPAASLDIQDRVATIVLDDREKRNSFSVRMMTELLATLELVTSRDDVRVVVLTGSAGWFSAGGDLTQVASRQNGDEPRERSIARLRGFMRISQLLRESEQITIAAVNGRCAGAGLAVAAACDLRVCDESSVFRAGFIDAARSGDFGGSWLLARLLGEARAKELYLLNRKVHAREALRIGLVSDVLHVDSFTEDVASLARDLAGKSGVATALMKGNLNSSHLSFVDALEREARRHTHTTLHPDAVEAAAAFVEKRPPRFADNP